ncbi:MAG: hypothetical protein ACREF5_00255 [Candidatus Saccharimonadales bacterium]
MDKRPTAALRQQLLLSVVEQLKMPLISIARSAELANLQSKPINLEIIRATADATLHLIDSYILGIQMAGQESELFAIEPVSVSSVLYDAGDQLQPMAKAYGVQLDLCIDGKYGPVMAHRLGLQAALVSLGYSLVEALPAMETPKARLELSAYRCRYGIVTGLYCETEQVTTQALRLGRQLYGRARQPLGNMSHTSGAGVFVADAILQGMRSHLTVSRHRKMHGLGAVLPMNPQLQFI